MTFDLDLYLQGLSTLFWFWTQHDSIVWVIMRWRGGGGGGGGSSERRRSSCSSYSWLELPGETLITHWQQVEVLRGDEWQYRMIEATVESNINVTAKLWSNSVWCCKVHDSMILLTTKGTPAQRQFSYFIYPYEVIPCVIQVFYTSWNIVFYILCLFVWKHKTISYWGVFILIVFYISWGSFISTIVFL